MTPQKNHSRAESKVIWMMVVLLVLLIGLAIYGYTTGSWKEIP